jgi:tRNA A37 threonylcarbamoyladenosine dehydratase
MNMQPSPPVPVPAPGEAPVQKAAPGREAPARESIADLFRRLIDDITALIRTELRLARTELRASIASAAGSVAAIAIGGLLAMSAMTCVLVATIVWLAEHIGLLAAVLSVAGVLAAVAAVLIVAGVSKLQQLDLAPKRASANLKKNADVLKGD